MRRTLRAMAAVLALAPLVVVSAAPSAFAGPETSGHSASAGERSAAEPAANDVTAHLFMWPWQDVARECQEVLGPAGYGAVQVSPPQEHVELPDSGYPWWESYQPVSYQLSSRFGDQQDFAAMVRTCHQSGVRVYADVVINHMTGQASGGVGSGGTEYGYYDYPGLYGYDDFNHCGVNDDDTIVDWSDAWEIQNCQLLGLSDLATGADNVRQTIAGYLNSLLGLGVDGFRVDAAKHIPATDLEAITALLDRPAYIYQEVLGDEPIAKSEYLTVGSVIEDTYGTEISRVFKTGQLSWLEQFGEEWGFSASDTAVTYVDSHDTERDSSGASLTYKDGPLFDLATVFELAWPYGHPLLLSGFGFTDYDAAPPGTTADGDVSGVSCGGVTSGPGGWLCQDRTQSTLGMVAFRNLVAGTSVTNWWSDGENQIAFARGTKGFVVVNRDAGALSRTFDTGLPAGIYCDLTHGVVRSGRCSGPTVTVDQDGQTTATIPGLSTLAIDVASRVWRASATSEPTVTFHAYATVDADQALYVTGNAPELGAWDPDQAVPLDSANYPNWSAQVTVAPGTELEYKLLKRSGDGTVVEETRSSRTATVPADGWLSTSDGWETGGTVDASVTLHVTADAGQTLYLVGNVEALGSWDPAKAAPLSQSDDGTWSGAVTLPGATSLEYKYIQVDADGGVVWESGSNRTVTTPASGTMAFDDTWR